MNVNDNVKSILTDKNAIGNKKSFTVMLKGQGYILTKVKQDQLIVKGVDKRV